MFRIVTIVSLFLALLAPRPASALENEDLLALVAMPLAVAAVSEIADVPVNQLIDVVSLLNDAAVPPVQFVEVVRYVPVALVEQPDELRFSDWVRQRYASGLREVALVDSIEERFRVYDLRDVDFDRPAVRVIEVVESPLFISPEIRTRVAERSSHPHGGPPGQLKKERGLQTGAEVVHGTSPGRSSDVATRVVPRDDDRRSRGSSARADDDDRGPGRKDRANRGDGRGKPEVKQKDVRREDGDRARGKNDGGGRGKGNAGGNKGNNQGKGKGKN